MVSKAQITSVVSSLLLLLSCSPEPTTAQKPPSTANAPKPTIDVVAAAPKATLQIQNLLVEPTSLTLKKWETKPLDIFVTANGKKGKIPLKNIKFTSADPKVAVVNGGMVSGENEGQTTITVQVQEQIQKIAINVSNETNLANVDGASNQNLAVQELQIQSDNVEVALGKSRLLEASVLMSDGTANRNIIWSSEDESIVGVNDQGKVRRYAPGDTQIYLISKQDSRKSGVIVVKGGGTAVAQDCNPCVFTPPPGFLKAQDTTDKHTTLVWEPVPDASSYVVTLNNRPPLKTKQPRLEINDLEANTDYQAQVVAWVGDEQSIPQFTEFTATTSHQSSNQNQGNGVTEPLKTEQPNVTEPAKSGQPDSPDATAENITSNSLTLNWKSVAGANGYKVYRNDLVVADNLDPFAQTYLFSNLNPDTLYQLGVSSFNSMGESPQAKITARTKASTPTIPAEDPPPGTEPQSPSSQNIIPLIVGVSQSGTVMSDKYQRYSFEATGGTTYTLKATATSGDPDLFVGNLPSVDANNKITSGENNGSESLDFTPSTSGTYYIAVLGFSASSYQIEAKIKAASSGNTSTPPSSSPTVNIAVTSPSSNQTLTKGTNYNVLWNSNATGNVKVKAFKGSTEHAVLGANEANDGSLAFNPPSNWPDGSDYRIQVMDLNSSAAAYSGYFTVQAPATAPPPSPTIEIAVTSPSSNQTLTKGTNYNVTWSANVSGNVKVKVFKGSTEYAVLGANEINDGNLTFNPPSNWPDGSDYRIQVMDLNSSAANYSGYFTIATPALSPPSPPSLNSPSSGESVSPGNINFSWGTSSGAGRYHLMVCTNSSLTSGCVNPDGAMEGVEPGTNTSTTVNLSAGTYYWAVRAICPGDACSWGSYSSVRSLTVSNPTPTCPAIPTGVSVSYNSGQSGNYLTWNSVAGASGYRIYWGNSNSVTTSSNQYGFTSSTAALHTGVSGGFTYYYRVLATGSCDSGLSSTASVTVPQPVPLPSVGSISQTTMGGQRVIIVNVSSSGYPFQVYRGSGGSADSVSASNNDKPSSEIDRDNDGAYGDWGVAANTRYCYRFEAINESTGARSGLTSKVCINTVQ